MVCPQFFEQFLLVRNLILSVMVCPKFFNVFALFVIALTIGLPHGIWYALFVMECHIIKVCPKFCLISMIIINITVQLITLTMFHSSLFSFCYKNIVLQYVFECVSLIVFFLLFVKTHLNFNHIFILLAFVSGLLFLSGLNCFLSFKIGSSGSGWC